MIKYFISLFIIITLVAGCSDDVNSTNTEPTEQLRIDLQSGYSDTQVKIFLDNYTVFDDKVSTNDVVSVAAIIPLEVNAGTHYLKVTVNNLLTKETLFTIGDALYIGVNYSSSNLNIMFNFSDSAFLYD